MASWRRDGLRWSSLALAATLTVMSLTGCAARWVAPDNWPVAASESNPSLAWGCASRVPVDLPEGGSLVQATGHLSGITMADEGGWLVELRLSDSSTLAGVPTPSDLSVWLQVYRSWGGPTPDGGVWAEDGRLVAVLRPLSVGGSPAWGGTVLPLIGSDVVMTGVACWSVDQQVPSHEVTLGMDQFSGIPGTHTEDYLERQGGRFKAVELADFVAAAHD